MQCIVRITFLIWKAMYMIDLKQPMEVQEEETGNVK
jgi:hypothetical protein